MRLALAAVSALALAAVSALALAAAGCGGVESEPNLAEAAERTEASGTFLFEGTSHGDEPSDCEGAVDSARKLARLTCDGGEFGSSETVAAGEAMYVRAPRNVGKWSKLPAADENVFDTFSPSALLRLLRSASVTTERAGEEDVRGEPTVRYDLTVDCERAEIPDCESETAVVGVWIDDDGVVRRIRVGEVRSPFDLELFGFGAPVEIEVPPADQVVEERASVPLETQPCEPVEAEPIQAEQVVDALRRHGFRPAAHPRCRADSPLAALVTAERDPGYVHCNVLVAPEANSRKLPPVPSPEAETRTVANVTCTLYGKPADKRDALASFDAALTELERELGP